MDFENLDLQTILDEVAESGISVSEAGDRLSGEEESAYATLREDAGDVSVILLDESSAQGTGLRNLAETVMDSGRLADGVETVIVRAPHNTQVVSDAMSRYQIESNQGSLHGSLEAADIPAFLEAAVAAEPDFSALNVVILAGVLVTVIVAAFFARLTYRSSDS